MNKLLRQAKKWVKVALGREFFISPDMSCNTERFGSGYGGWEVAVDGIDSESVVYSFGIGHDASFDVALMNRFGLQIHAFDPTPGSIEWVRRQGFPDRFILHEYGLAAFDGDVSFNPPEDPRHISHTLLDKPSTSARAITVPVKRLSTIMEALGHDHIDLLKMDIEGAEYDVIRDIHDSAIRPRLILVEFHHRFPGVGVRKTREAIALLFAMGYRLYAVSDTNEEFGFIRASDR